MSWLSRFLDWLDEAAAGLIRIAYLLAGITAVAVYFGAGHLPAGVQAALDGALPWVLAGAVETHTYLSARRVRSAWQDMQAASLVSQERMKAIGALKVNLGVLAFLVAFSCWNQLNYLYDTWKPPHTTLALPGWLAYVVRALVIPAAFMAAAFLAPLALPIAAQIEQEARATLADVFKIARRQRRKMLETAEREGRDMTGALVELVTDAELRRVISHAYTAISASPSIATFSQAVPIAAPSLAVQPEDFPPEPPDEPAHNPSQPSNSERGESVAEDMPYVPSLRALPSREQAKRRTVGKMSAEDAQRVKAFALLDAQPEMSKAELRKLLGCRQERANSLYAKWMYSSDRATAVRG